MAYNKLTYRGPAISVERNAGATTPQHGSADEAETLVYVSPRSSKATMSYDETVALRKALKAILKAHDADKAKLAEAAKPKPLTNRELVRALSIDTVFTFNGIARVKYIRGEGDTYRKFGEFNSYPLCYIPSSTGITVIHPKPVPEVENIESFKPKELTNRQKMDAAPAGTFATRDGLRAKYVKLGDGNWHNLASAGHYPIPSESFLAKWKLEYPA